MVDEKELLKINPQDRIKKLEEIEKKNKEEIQKTKQMIEDSEDE